MIGVVVVPPGFDAETRVAGLRPLLRHALALQAAGAREVFLAGAPADPPADRRVRVPVRRAPKDAALWPSETALVVPAGVTYHRLLPKRLAARAPGAQEVVAAGDGEARLFAAGAARVVALVDALSAGRDPGPRATMSLGPGDFVLEARSPGERRAAMRPHLRSLVKPTGGAIDRHLMRPVSLQLTRLLSRTAITPNVVSIASLAMAVAAAALVAMQDHRLVLLGAALHVLMRVVDCVDGELARLRYQQSRLGEWLDTVGDGFGIAVLVAAVAWRASASDPAWLLVGGAGVAAWMAVQGLQYAALARAGGRGSLQFVEWGHRDARERTFVEAIASRVDVLLRIDFISVAYAILIAADAGETLLVVHGLVAVGATAYFASQLRRRPPVVNPDRAQ